MTINYSDRSIDFTPEKLAFTERLSILSELPDLSVGFVDKSALVADAAGNIKISTMSSVFTPASEDQLCDSVRFIKLTADCYIIDRSHSFDDRQMIGENTVYRIEDWGPDSQTSNTVANVIGLIDTPAEFEIAAPIIAEQFEISLEPIEQDDTL